MDDVKELRSIDETNAYIRFSNEKGSLILRALQAKNQQIFSDTRFRIEHGNAVRAVLGKVIEDFRLSYAK